MGIPALCFPLSHELGLPERLRWITLRESYNAVDGVENEDRDHGKVKDPSAPERIGPNNAENE